MPKKINCITCQWEPEWYDDREPHLGYCQYPNLPASARLQPISKRGDGNVICGWNKLTMCSAWTEKKG